MIYSLVETANETGVNPYDYFVYMLGGGANLGKDGKPVIIADLTPEYSKKLTENSEDCH